MPARVRRCGACSQAAAPDVEPSRTAGARLPVLGCTAAKPVDWVLADCPGPGGSGWRLCDAGISAYGHSRRDFRLGAQNARAAWLGRRPLSGAGPRRRAPREAAAYYLDFEPPSRRSALRRHATVSAGAVQWSLHRVDAAGRVLHRRFSPSAAPIPRPPPSLLAALVGATDLVWSASRSAGSRSSRWRCRDAAESSRYGPLIDLSRSCAGVGREFGGSFSLKQWRRCSPRPSPTTASTRERRRRGRVGSRAAGPGRGRVRGRGSRAPPCAPRVLPAHTLALLEVHRALRHGRGPGGQRSRRRGGVDERRDASDHRAAGRITDTGWRAR